MIKYTVQAAAAAAVWQQISRERICRLKIKLGPALKAAVHGVQEHSNRTLHHRSQESPAMLLADELQLSRDTSNTHEHHVNTDTRCWPCGKVGDPEQA